MWAIKELQKITTSTMTIKPQILNEILWICTLNWFWPIYHLISVQLKITLNYAIEINSSKFVAVHRPKVWTKVRFFLESALDIYIWFRIILCNFFDINFAVFLFGIHLISGYRELAGVGSLHWLSLEISIRYAFPSISCFYQTAYALPINWREGFFD